MRYLFWKVNSLLYRILGPNNSTRLSQSALGLLILKLFTGYDNTFKIYRGTEGISLKLTGKEANYIGFLHFGTMNVYETDIMKTILKKGDTFIDVGAFIDGWHSIIASKLVGREGRVYSFEPIPEFFKRVKENITLNNLSNVTLEMKAVAHKDGTQTFYENNASSSMFQNHAYHGKKLKSKVVIVKTVSLDTYVLKHKISGVRMIKIDAEGAEMNVLQGAITILKPKTAPDLLIEIDDTYLHSGGSSENEVISFLTRIGYNAYSITKDGLGQYKRKIDGRELFNVYFSKNRLLK